MSKRILTNKYTHAFMRNADSSEGTNWKLIRIYGAIYWDLYAVIIADDNRFEEL